jgi:hypothetical protein
MAEEEKTEKVKVGRAVEVDNVAYGPGEYLVTPSVARKLRAKNATASAAETMRVERERRQTPDDGGEPSGEGRGASNEGVIIGGQGEGGSTGGGSTGGGSPSSERDDAQTIRGPQGTNVPVKALEGLTGELPADFPARDVLAKGVPDKGIEPVTTYEQVVKLTREQLNAFPGLIGTKAEEEIGQRLFADAERAGVGAE